MFRKLRYWAHNRRLRKLHRPGAEKNLADFEKLSGYRFNDLSLLEHALKHRSILADLHETRSSANERLEFLGDAVLDLVVSERLYREYPDSQEGFLARMKSTAVSGRQLAAKAREINLGDFIQISSSEARNGGRKRRSILEDALEAITGAIYLDGGLDRTKKFINRFIINDLSKDLIREREENYKSLLLEYSQGLALGAPVYRVKEESGPDHAKTFIVEVLVDNQPVGTGEGRSKKRAEQEAAKIAVRHFGVSG